VLNYITGFPLYTTVMLRRIWTKRNPAVLLIIGGIVLLLFAVGLNIKQTAANNRANAAAAKAVALANAGKPSPAPATIKPTPAAVASYTVPATHPRYLKIPTLGVNARVMPVGLTKTNAIGTPSNVYDTAWYTGSNLPGQPGATLIDGHVSSWTTNGVFYGLKTLKAGDAIQLQLGNDTTLNYTVVKTQTYASGNVDVNSLLTPITKNKPGLNLITCAGDVIKNTNEFNQRIIVYASLN
jgi:LPXTG-site transpeptidase (sortase) family protein